MSRTHRSYCSCAACLCGTHTAATRKCFALGLLMRIGNYCHSGKSLPIVNKISTCWHRTVLEWESPLKQISCFVAGFKWFKTRILVSFHFEEWPGFGECMQPTPAEEGSFYVLTDMRFVSWTLVCKGQKKVSLNISLHLHNGWDNLTFWIYQLLLKIKNKQRNKARDAVWA